MSLREQLQAIYDTHGKITPPLVVEAARPKSHPLHNRVFDKLQPEAAEEYYKIRAQELIKSVKITYKDGNGESQTIRAFHCLRQESGCVYEPLEEIIKDDFKRKLLLMDMKREWQQFKDRYDHFNEFWQMVKSDVA